MNPFRYRARVDRIWRRAVGNNPAHIRIKALETLFREHFAPTPEAQANYARYLATDPFDVARHKLRDLYDAISPPAQGGGRCLVEPAPSEGGGTEGGPPHADESPPEDPDPL